MTPNEMLTQRPDDASARFLREKIKEGFETLRVLDEPPCTRTQALAAWDKFYATDYFGKRDASNEGARAAAIVAGSAGPAILTARTEPSPPPVRKSGGGRYA